MFVVFGETGDGDVEVQLVVDDIPCHVHLSFAAVDNQQVWHYCLLTLIHSFISSFDDFGHGAVVVVIFGAVKTSRLRDLETMGLVVLKT